MLKTFIAKVSEIWLKKSGLEARILFEVLSIQIHNTTLSKIISTPQGQGGVKKSRLWQVTEVCEISREEITDNQDSTNANLKAMR